MTYKNSSLCISQGHDQCIGSSKSDYRYGCASLQSSRINCYGLKLAFHIQILVLIVLLLKDQTEAIYNFLPSNKWPDGEVKQHNRGVS